MTLLQDGAALGTPDILTDQSEKLHEGLTHGPEPKNLNTSGKAWLVDEDAHLHNTPRRLPVLCTLVS